MPFDFSQTETKVPIAQPPGGGRAVGVLTGRSYYKVESGQTQGAYAILEQHVPAGHGPPYHVHRRETEIFYILEGDFEFTVDGKKLPGPPGTCVVGPRDIPHTFRNVGTTPGRLLLTVIPGRFSQYFTDVDNVPDGDHAAIRALCAKYEVEILE